ncbi:hypothetical protein KAR02_14235, partial [Candidatus Bipolaricaulota bacterium]|nr:hypothetical protein [Candidatus Bipolaricaulota bacterium]
GLFALSATPVGVVAAQECLPGRTGLVSGLVMGLAWGMGGLALTPIGWFADMFGLITVMSFVAVLPLVGAGFMLFYKEDRGADPHVAALVVCASYTRPLTSFAYDCIGQLEGTRRVPSCLGDR